jgi:hypothetical protein
LATYAKFKSAYRKEEEDFRETLQERRDYNRAAREQGNIR